MLLNSLLGFNSNTNQLVGMSSNGQSLIFNITVTDTYKFYTYAIPESLADELAKSGIVLPVIANQTALYENPDKHKFTGSSCDWFGESIWDFLNSYNF